MIKGVYSINIAVKDLVAATKKYEAIFGVKSEALGEKNFAFPGLVGSKINANGFYINLIASTVPGTSIANFVERKGEGVFLVALETDNIEADTEHMRNQGIEFVLKEPATGAFGAVNFGHPKTLHGVQIELRELSPRT